MVHFVVNHVVSEFLLIRTLVFLAHLSVAQGAPADLALRGTRGKDGISSAWLHQAAISTIPSS